jgi:alpha-L-fucosidase
LRRSASLSTLKASTMNFGFPGNRLTAIRCMGFLLVSSAATGTHASAADASATPRVDYATQHIIAPGDSPALIVEKAAKVLPRPNQSAWMRLERTFFLHYGPNTFRRVEWGDGREDPATFNPTALDAGQWLRAAKGAGGKLFILVSKHHDGLCLWPTRYTRHSVAASPWRNGKGDLVREVADAARAQGVKLGIYLSPADLYQLRTNPKNPAGYYGNGSQKRRSTIPTDPGNFQTDPAKGRPPTPGFESYTYEVDDYNRYFLNQLYELLTEYGPISVAWFDGANPDPSVKQTYDYAAWYDLIRRLQPEAVISVKGPDVRWVGTESGVGRTTEWSVIPLSDAPERFTWPDMHGALGERARLTPGSHLWWYPAEVNTSILHGWFWAEHKGVKSPASLVDYYYTSVGRNGVMLLNLAPDTRGLVPDNQLASLNKMAQVVEATFARDLATGAKVTADSSQAGTGVEQARDGNPDTWWEAAPGQHRGTFTFAMPAAITFDVVSLQEAVDHRSQRIESFVIEAWSDGSWTAPATVEEQTTVGRKRLMRLAVPVTTDRVRIRITGSRLEPTLAEVGLFKQSLPGAPVIADRTRDGVVSVTHPHPMPIVYTLDGSEPSASSPIYKSPVSLPRGGTLKAAVLTGDGAVGLSESVTAVGLAPIGWKAMAAPAEADSPASRAIDADEDTIWKSRAAKGEGSHPQVTIDMGALHRIAGLAYLPPQNWNSPGVVDRYRFETSRDGNTWTVQVKSGYFGNMRNNPIFQEVRFAPVEARFFRFVALHDIDDSGWASAAEITVLPAP